MDYRVKKMGHEMHFLTKSFKNVALEVYTFDISAGKKIVSAGEIASCLSRLPQIVKSGQGAFKKIFI
jgi:hypothetical protein